MIFFISRYCLLVILVQICLTRCARNLVLFCVYFGTAEITKDFCDSRCNFQGAYIFISNYEDDLKYIRQ